MTNGSLSHACRRARNSEQLESCRSLGQAQQIDWFFSPTVGNVFGNHVDGVQCFCCGSASTTAKLELGLNGRNSNQLESCRSLGRARQFDLFFAPTVGNVFGNHVDRVQCFCCGSASTTAKLELGLNGRKLNGTAEALRAPVPRFQVE